MPENPSVFHARSGFYLQDGDLIYILITNYSEDREYKIKKKKLNRYHGIWIACGVSSAVTSSRSLFSLRPKWSKCKVKTVPLQARRGPEGSRNLSFPDFKITVVRLSALRTGRLYPQEKLISVRGWVDLTAIVRLEGFYVNEKFQWLSDL